MYSSLLKCPSAFNKSMNKYRQKIEINKTIFLIIASALAASALFIRLFDLQVLSHDYYEKVATREQLGYTEIPAKRGEILIKDLSSGEEFPLATNITLNLLYADPTLIKNPAYVVDQLTPLLFNLEEDRAADEERLKKLAKNLPPEITEEEKAKILQPLTDTELQEQFKQVFLKKISQTRRSEILLTNNLEKSKIDQIAILKLGGIKIDNQKVFAYPDQISNLQNSANLLAPLVEIPSLKLAQILKGENRYVVLKNKLAPEISDKIKSMKSKDKDKQFIGLGMKEEYFRYYPEGKLGANVLGYVNRENIGQYGIESSFNTQLQGIKGEFQTKKDSIGRQITVGESVLKPAVDGDDIVLTIDRSIQLKIEKLLEEGVKEFMADNGQILIMNPKTGAIIAMAHYPSFDPNIYGDVFRKIEVNFTPEEIARLVPTKTPETYYFYENEEEAKRYIVFETPDENKKVHYYRYANIVGPEVYHNKIVSWPYEPGSVFKAIVMAMAIDDGDVTPNTTYNDSGPVKVDFNVYTQKYDFEIKNSTGYHGLVNMTTVLAMSLNTGMTFISKKIGPALMYSYLKKFGLLDRTDIEFDTESLGSVEHFDGWTESELATHAFGQGITITMMQLANAYSAIANGGILMQPFIVQEVRHKDGSKLTTDPTEIRRVISEETSSKVTAMLIQAVEVGVAKKAKLDTHYMAGKTGTAQTYKNGRVLTGRGTTIGTLVGFAPIKDPKFMIVVKYDRPRSSVWADDTASVTFNKIAAYLFDYYNIPPDK